MEEEKKNKKKAILISTIIHGSLLLLVIFLIAWRVPDPPNPEFGIEINFGTQNIGKGKIQPKSTQDRPTQEEQVEESQEDNQEVQEEAIDPVVEEVVENTQSTEVVQDVPVEDTAVETSESAAEEVSTVDSPDVVEAQPEEEEPKPVKEETKKEQEEPKTTPKENTKPEAEFPKPASSSTSAVKNADEDNDSSGNGDKSTDGDQGRPDGKVEAQALYGNPGSSNGSSLELSGWKWDDEPKPDDKSTESGKIVFEITVDDEGYITKIVTIEKTVTPAVVQVYKREVEELTFSKNSDYKPAPFSTGRITFIIKAN